MKINVTRQPLLDRHFKAYGYELLYQSDLHKHCSRSNCEKATAAVIVNNILRMDIDTVARGKRAFIKFSKHLLTQGAALLLPNSDLVVGISIREVVDQATINACAMLRLQGYQLSLEDFSFHDRSQALLELADIIKIDYSNTKPEELRDLINVVKRNNKKVIVKNIETRQAYRQSFEFNSDFFQGFFICEPEIVSGKDIPENKLHYLKMLNEVYKEEIDFTNLELMIKQDPALSYKLLKHINTVGCSSRIPIHSIRQAITMLGQNKLVQWASLVSLRHSSFNQPGELIVIAITRAYFCENLSMHTCNNKHSEDLFLAGLFSLLDVFLGRSMESILEELPLAKNIKELLLGKENILSPYLRLVLAHERADWQEVKTITAALGINENELLNAYLTSLKQADLITAQF